MPRDRGSDDIVLSVVCAARNAAHCIEGLLDSYRRERSDRSELIVLDGASTDSTWQLVDQNHDIVDDASSEPDGGIYDAWNKALPRCRGRWVAFIGADDRLASGSVDALVAACLGAADEVDLLAGFNILTRQALPVALLGAPYDARRLVRRMMIAHVMSAHRLSWLRSVNGFDASYRSSGDYELLLRERHRLQVQVIPDVLAFMADGGISRATLRPYTENFRARRSNGCSWWLSSALFARAMAGRAARRALGL